MDVVNSGRNGVNGGGGIRESWGGRLPNEETGGELLTVPVPVLRLGSASSCQLSNREGAGRRWMTDVDSEERTR